MAIRTTPNATRVPLNIVGGSVFGRYNKISSEKTYNMFISDGWLVNFAGYKRVLEILSEGEGRGIFRSIRGNFIIAVVNSSVYRIEENLSFSLIGNLLSSSGRVFMDENLSSQICIVDGVTAYIYNHSLAPNLTVQALSPSLSPSYVSYHNTFFLFGNGNRTTTGAHWYAYSYDTSTTIAETTELSLQTKPDYAIAVHRIPSQGNNVLVFGTSVCEIHTQVGGNENYVRNSTINVDYGCLSPSTIAASDKYIAWLAVNESNAPTLMVYTGQGAQEISTDGINYLFQELSHPEDSTAMFYRQDGHLFYQLTFYNPDDNLTLIYDFNTQQFFNLSDENTDYHPAVTNVYFNKKSYFLSLNDASLYEINTNYTTYDYNILSADSNLIYDIPRVRITQSLRKEDSARFLANSLVVTIEQGTDKDYSGLSSVDNNYLITDVSLEPIYTEDGQLMVPEDYDPTLPKNQATSYASVVYRPRVDLSLSYDGGVTFGNTVARELNPIGKRKNMLMWEKMGAANDLTFKFKFWGMSRFIVNNGTVDLV